MNRPLAIALGTYLLVASGCASTASARRFESIALASEDRSVRVLAGDEHFATLRLARGESTFITELLAPGEIHVLRGFPSEPRPEDSRDHPEHRGIWSGHGAMQGVDTWSDPDRAIVRSDEIVLGGEGAQLNLGIVWSDARGVVLCDERRTLRFGSQDDVRFVDVTHELRAPGAGLTFEDVRNAFFAARLADSFDLDAGSAVRLVSDMNGDQAGLGLDPENPWGERARWIATTATLSDRDGASVPVTVAVLDHPLNHGHPARWQVRRYGLVAANPFGVGAFASDSSAIPLEALRAEERGGLVLRPFRAMTLRYRVIVAATSLDQQALEAQWRDFAGIE